MKPAEVAKKADTKALAFLASAEGLTITTPAEYESSALMLRQVTAQRKTLETQRTDITKPMDEAKRKVMDLFKPVAARFEAAEATLRGALAVFTQREEEKRKKEQARLDELARKKEERLQERAAEQREQGHEERAEALEETATQVVAREAAPVTKAAGVHARVTWSAEVMDIQALIRACAEGKTPYEGADLLVADMTVLNALARAQKDKLDIPGVKAVSNRGMVV